MEIQITKNLKEFRRKHGNTQEDLATHLNISVQAVSKWERGESFPDIALLPQIAAYYNTSVDDLLGCGEIERNKKIKEYHDQWLANAKEGKQEENIAMLHEAVKEFPHDVGLLSDLCFTLQFSRKEEYTDECIEVGKAILDQNPTEEFYRHRAIQCIALAYHQKGALANAHKYAELLPDFFHTKNKTLEQLLEGEEKWRCAQENIMHSLHMIDNSAFSMLHAGNYSPKERIYVREAIAKMYDLFLYDGDYLESYGFLGNLWLFVAYDYAELSDVSGTIKAMKNAYTFSRNANSSVNYHSNSLFFNRAHFGNGVEIKINPKIESPLDAVKTAMTQPQFDFVSDMDEWKAIFSE